MSYTYELFADDPSGFPHPPTWLIWSNSSWNNKNLGQVRHYSSLRKARKYVSGWTNSWQNPESPVFTRDWAIYWWNGTTYEIQYHGKKGQAKKECELFQTVPPEVATGSTEVELVIDSIKSTILRR